MSNLQNPRLENKLALRLSGQDTRKLGDLCDVALASPSDTIRFIIRGLTPSEMEAIRERALKQQGR
jgi:hypothetical protein